MKPIDGIRRDAAELDRLIGTGAGSPPLERIDAALVELELEQRRFQEFAGIVRSWALTNESKTILNALIQLDLPVLPKATLTFLREQERCRQALNEAAEKYRQARLEYDVSLAIDDSQKRYNASRGLDAAQEALGEASYAWAVILGQVELLGPDLENRVPQR